MSWITRPDRGDRLSLYSWIVANDGRNCTHRLYHKRWFRALFRWIKMHRR